MPKNYSILSWLDEMMSDDDLRSKELHSQIHYRLVEELSQSERRFRYLVNNIHDLVFSLDWNGVIVFANQAWKDLLGFEVRSVIDMRFTNYLVEDDTRRRIEDFLTNVRSLLGSPSNPDARTLEPLVLKDVAVRQREGALVWMDLSFEPSVDQRIDGIAINISERKKSEELVRLHAHELEHEVSRQTQRLQATIHELKTTQVQLIQQSRLATIGNLVSGIAHEIRNPLNLVVGGGRANAYMNLISRGSLRVDEIVHNLNRLAATGKSPEKQICEIAETVGATLELTSEKIKGSSMTVDNRVPQGLYVCVNGGELSQVVLYLIINAVEATGRDGTLTLRAWRDDDDVHLEVHDDGPGVPKELQHQIFDPFFTTKGTTTNSGLGLAVSHRMMRDSEGHLGLEPTDRGACFRLTLRAVDIDGLTLAE